MADLGQLQAPIAEYMAKLGAVIAADAARYAPKRTGELAGSIHPVVEGTTVRIVASAPYAAYVEEGHRIVAWGHNTGKIEPPEPFLRPALYQERGAL